MIIYLLALVPLTLFLYQPLSELLSSTSSTDQNAFTLTLNESFIAIPGSDPITCPAHTYTTHILSVAPLMVYIEGFLTRNESEHLVRISDPLYEASTISHGSTTTHDPSIRLSSIALLPRDPTVRCIEDRARSFQGWKPNLHIERLRTQKYDAPGGHYRHHFDWSGRARGQDRVSTFLVYVDAENVEGGGTEFPRVRNPVRQPIRSQASERLGGKETEREAAAERSGGEERAGGAVDWCRFVTCEEGMASGGENGDEIGGGNTVNSQPTSSTGVTFKPLTGNAVFWLNLAPGGRGYQETYHAGLPVTKGTKVGLNIWSWGNVNEMVG